MKQPGFEVSENTIKIELPVFEKSLNLTEDEREIYRLLSKTMLKSISEIVPYAPFGKSKTTQLLKTMGQKGVVKIEGRGRGTKGCDMEIKRDIYLNKLISKKHNGLIKVVTGIRRCGKSYLLFNLFKDYLLAEGTDEQHVIEIAFDSFEYSLIGYRFAYKSYKVVSHIQKCQAEDHLQRVEDTWLQCRCGCDYFE